MVVGGGVQAASTAVLGYLVYPYAIALAAVIAFLLAAGLVGQGLLRRRLEKATADLEFAA